MTRLAVTLAATAALALPAFLAVPAGAAGVVHQRVTAGDLGPAGPWLRLQDDPGNAGRPAGVQEVSPFADPVHFNGSLHLAVAGAAEAQQAQAAHYFPQAVALAAIAAGPLSYDLYVQGATSTPSAVAFGANLQLPGFCLGAFTTLSFQPQLATDAEGRTGAVADAWRHFSAGGDAMWRTSRAVGPFAAGSDHPLSDYVDTCTGTGDGAIGVIANVGRLGDPAADLDTYVDNLTVDGTQYDFAVDGTATGTVAVTPTGPGEPCEPGGPGTWSTEQTPARALAAPGTRGGGGEGTSCSLEGTVTFTSPADGPYFSDVATRLVLSGHGGLSPQDVTVTANGAPVTLTAGPGGTLIATILPPSATDLPPGGTYTTSFAVDCAPHHTAPVTITAELLARGYAPLTPTGVVARS